MPASLKDVAQQLPAPSAETLAELAAVQPLKREAFDAGAVIWTTWNGNYAYTTTSSTATMVYDAAWFSWNVTYTGAGGSTMAYDANSNTAIPSGGPLTVTGGWTTWNTAYQETGDERLERERLNREAHERRETAEAERQAVREKADARALELLRSLLSDAQWASYQEKGWFEVRGSSGRRWRIRNRGQSGNVDLMPEIGEERDATYCAHPPGGLPAADAHAAQMLALVTDDEAFLRTANEHWRRPPTAEELAERAEQGRRDRERLHATAHERVHVGREPWASGEAA